MGVRGKDRRLLYFLGQAAERGAERPAGQQPANGDQQWAGAGDRADKRSSDRCHYLSLMQIQWELDDTGPDTDRRACAYVCVCVCVYVWRAWEREHVCVSLMEHDRGEVDYRGDYNFLVTLVWAPPRPPCMHVCVYAIGIWVQPTWPCLVTVKTARSVTHHMLRIQGRREKHITFGPKFHCARLLTLKYAEFTSPKDVLVIWRTKNVSGWGFWMWGGGVRGGYMAMRLAGLAKAEKGC